MNSSPNRSLNITRLTGFVLPVLTVVATGIGEILEKEPWNDATFQRNLFLLMVVVIAVVSIADIFARAIARPLCTSRRSAWPLHFRPPFQ